MGSTRTEVLLDDPLNASVTLRRRASVAESERVEIIVYCGAVGEAARQEVIERSKVRRRWAGSQREEPTARLGSSRTLDGTKQKTR